MPLDSLPGKLVVPSRNQLHDKFLKWVLVRNSSEDTRPGSQPDQDANVWADAGTSLLTVATQIAGSITRANMKGAQLDAEAQRLGTQRDPAVGASGAIALVASVNGAQLFAGDVLTYGPTGLRYEVTQSGIYQNAQQVPVAGIDTGPQTNLQAGSVLTWQSPRPGVVGSTAAIVAQADGTGLSGGTLQEDDDTLRARLDSIAANPPASGNDSQYQQAVTQTFGVAVQQAFTYPAISGPGTVGVAFTLRPSVSGGNRIPTSAQQSIVLSALGGVMPGSDSILMCSLLPNNVTVVLKVLWAIGAAGWADSTTFPAYHASPNLVSASANAGGVLSPLAFRLSSSSMTEVPQVGQNIGFLDLANRVFRRKKILTVSTISSTTYDLTVDTTNGVSDTSYAPLSGQPCCPWSDSLNSLLPPLLAYFDTLGPGEQVASFFDPGLRQRRSPISPQYWPSSINNRIVGGALTPVPAAGPQQNQPPVPTLLTTSTLQDVVVQEPSLPYAAPTGTAGVSSYLSVLYYLAAFPE